MENKQPGYTRREILKLSAAAGLGVAVGASGLGTVGMIVDTFSAKPTSSNKQEKTVIPFYGKHQAGIVTPQQTYLYLASFDITTNDRRELIHLLKTWTKLSERFTQGRNLDATQNDWLPPKDTGEALGLGASRLTITFGFGSSLFNKDGKDRFGLSHRKPLHLKPIPTMPRDAIDPSLSDGDIIVQVCADDQLVAFHAVRNLIKAAVGTATIKWLNAGFLNGKRGETPRNLFGFKDGTANLSINDVKKQNQVIWCGQGEPDWMKGGTYLAYRNIRMFLEIWDLSSLKEQEDTFGRRKLSGAPYGKGHEHDPVDVTKLPKDSHVALAKSTGQEIFRRGYNYSDGIEPKTGNPNAGLQFIRFQKNPQASFVPMLALLSKNDALNEYTKHIGSGLYAIPRGIKKGEYIGQALFS